MKKNLLINLLLAMLLGATNVWADSGLFLFGSEVPSTSNWTYSVTNNIVGYISLDTPVGAILNGTVSYDAATKTVTFNNVQAVVRDDRRILYNKGVSGLKIVFTGWATLWSDYCVFRLDQDTEIIGSEEEVNLRALGNNAECIYCPNATKLKIRNFGKLKMTSNRWRAINTSGAWMGIYNSNVYLKGADCAIQNNKGNLDEMTGNLRLHDCILRDSWGMFLGSIGEGCNTFHADAPFSSTLFHVHTSKAKSAMIIRSEDYLGVRLKGIALTKGWSINDDESNPSYGIEDYYTYDESTNTLTLEKDFRGKTGYGKEKKEELYDWIGIKIDRPITIEGNGHEVYAQRGVDCFFAEDSDKSAILNNIVIGGTETGIHVYYGNLTLKDDIIVGGVDSAIEFGKDLDGYYQGNVTFNPSFGKTITLLPCNSNFKVTDSFDEQAIIGNKAKLESCIITTPEGAEMFYAGPMLNGRPVKTKMVLTGITEYALKVGERQVTSVNASDILGDGGHFKYDVATNTLTVTNARLETESYGIDNEIDGLNINFVGASNFTTKYCTILSKSINLIGNGSLRANVTSTQADCPCIYLYNPEEPYTCTINGPQLDLTAKQSTIRADGSHSTLNVMGSSTCLRLHPGEGHAPILYLDVLNLGTGMYIRQPYGGYFENGNIIFNGLRYEGDVVIESDQNRKLGFSINGTEMTLLNMNNVPGVTSGSAHVEEATLGEPTLVLNNATLDWNDADAALYLKSGAHLTIKVLGNCVINAPDHTGLDLSGNTTITGGGTLRINSKWAAICNWEDTRFTLQNNTTLIAYSSDSYGYCDDGYDYDQQKSWFIIKDGGLFAAFGKNGPISLSSDRTINFDSYTDLRYPVGGQLWDDGYVYDTDGNEVTNDWAVIGWDTQKTDELIQELVYFPKRELGFSINGKNMTAADVNDVPGVVSGNAHIEDDPDGLGWEGTPTLVLDNATLDWDDAKESLNLQAGKKLTIKVLGDCTINDGLSISGNATITGGGTLRINSTGAAIETFDEASFTIRDNTKVVAHSSGWISYLDSGNNNGAYCTIESGCVFAAYGPGSFNPFMFGSRSATLGEGIGIRYPESCQLWGAYVYYVSDYDYYEITNDWVVFGPDNEATNELIQELVSNKRKLGFSINGQEMTTENMNDVPGLVSGRAYIEEQPETGVPILVLDHATLEWNEATYGLHNRSGVQPKLTIRVLGKCSISVPNGIALELDLATQTTIEGGGNLYITSGQNAIETWAESNLLIQDFTFVAVKSETEYSALLEHNGANIEISDNGLLAAYSKFVPLWLDPNSQFVLGEGIALYYPVDTYIDSKNRICNADGTEVMNDWVVFGPDMLLTQLFVKNSLKGLSKDLDFSINGQVMTTANMDDVPGVVSGSAYVTLSSHGEPTLVLDNATLEQDEEANCIDMWGASLRIIVLGDCSINVPNGGAVRMEDSRLIIEGGGKLHISSLSVNFDAIPGSQLTIQDRTVVIAESEKNFCYFSNYKSELNSFTIQNGGMFVVYSNAYSPMIYRNIPVLGEGIDVRYPAGASLSDMCAVNADGTIFWHDWLVIGPDNDAMQDLIDGIVNVNANLNADQNINEGVYNLAGQRLSKMQKGINIVNGKKVMVK